VVGSAWDVAATIVGLDPNAPVTVPAPAAPHSPTTDGIPVGGRPLMTMMDAARGHPLARYVGRAVNAAWSSLRDSAWGTLLAVLFVVAAFALHWMAQMNDVFGQMGFDPDRAQLVGSLLLGGIVAATSAIVSNRLRPAVLAGFAGATALFMDTFIALTRSAMASNGPAGVFDLGGWLISVAALVMSGLVAAWAGAAMAVVARPAITNTIDIVRAGVEQREMRGRAARRIGAVALAVVVLAATAPVFSDLVNYTVDVHMLYGGPPPIGLGGPVLTPDPSIGLVSDASSDPSIPPAATASPTASASAAAQPSTSPADSATPVPTRTYTDLTPWHAWIPSGVGTARSVGIQPAPWTGGENYAEVTIVTPPGYNPKGKRRYPVIYEAPYAFEHWNEAMGVSGLLDSLTDKGYMPAAIVVAMSTAGGPITDSECTDSFDGREWFDKYVVNQVVPYIDSHYLTIADARARATLGASQGGYCAPALASRHPDVFSTSISFSGYYHAGLLGPPSSIPFGTDKDFIDAGSPDVLLTRMSPAVRQTQYYIVIAKLDQALYGPEASRFATVLFSLDVPHELFDSTTPHGWTQMKREFQRAMEAWGTRLVLTGVFDTP